MKEKYKTNDYYNAAIYTAEGELRPCDADHDDNRFGLVVADVLRRTDAVR